MSVAEAIFYWWKKAYAAMSISEIPRLKQLEDENRKLKRFGRGPDTGQDFASGRTENKMVQPIRHSEVVRHY